MNSKSVSDLIDALEDNYWLHRSRAAESLGKLGPQAREAVPALRNALGDSHIEVRRDVTEALGKIGFDAADVVPELVTSLDDREIAGAAHNALKSIGLPAVPELINALGDSDRTLLAELILVSIGEPALDQLVVAPDSDSQTLRSQCLSVIASIAPAGRTDVLDAMARFAKKDTSQLRYERFLAANIVEKLDRSAAAQADMKSIYADLFGKD